MQRGDFSVIALLSSHAYTTLDLYIGRYRPHSRNTHQQVAIDDTPPHGQNSSIISPIEMNAPPVIGLSFELGLSNQMIAIADDSR